MNDTQQHCSSASSQKTVTAEQMAGDTGGGHSTSRPALLYSSPSMPTPQQSHNSASLLSVTGRSGSGGNRLSPPSPIKGYDVSPQILRRIQWQMKMRTSKQISPNRSTQSCLVKQHPVVAKDAFHSPSSVESPRSSATSVISSNQSGATSARLTFMDGRLPRFQRNWLRSRQQSLAEQGVWKSTDGQTWRSTNGWELKLRGKRLETLAVVERHALQKYAFAKLQKANLGCSVSKPKEALASGGQKRHRYTRHKAHTVSVVEKKKDANGKPLSPHGSGQQVFGVPLSQCIEYEQLMETVGASEARQQQTPDDVQSKPSEEVQQKTNGYSVLAPKAANAKPQNKVADDEPRCQSLDLDEMDFLHVARMSPHRLSASAESSKSSLSDQASSDSLTLVMRPTSSKGSLDAQTSEHLSANDRLYASSDNLLNSPCAQVNRSSSSMLNKQDSCEPHCPRVPKIVHTCTKYLKGHGLNTVGLFRIAGSAKRCRQLRLEMDSGQEIILDDDQAEVYPHDVATLLKEFFRDLPDPLLTKELYQAFVNAAKLPDDTSLEIVRYLIYLLPIANCDTLLMLLQFLRQVAVHSYDTINDQGVAVSGNKMNSHNLATIFAPTILRPGGSKRQHAQQWSDNEAVIKVVELMIDHCDDLFCISKEMLDAMYKSLQETDPDSVDTILTRMHSGSQESQSDEQEEQLLTTVYLSSQEDTDPPMVTKEADGTTVVKTRQQTTHRIIYKVHKQTGKILECMRDNSAGSSGSGSQGSCEFPDSKISALANEKFPELSLFAEDTPLNDAAELIDINVAKPQRKLTPLSRLSEAISNRSSPKK